MLSLSALQLWDLNSQNKARGPGAGFGCASPKEAPGQRYWLWCEVLVRARSDRSSLWQVSAQRVSVSHPDQWDSKPNIRRPHVWNICFGSWRYNSNMRKKVRVPTVFLLPQFPFCMQVNVVAVEMLILKGTKNTHWAAAHSRSSCGITETQTGACAHTHTLQRIPRGMLQRCSHVTMASVSLGHRAVVSDRLFSFPPCLFSKDSVINSLTRN